LVFIFGCTNAIVERTSIHIAEDNSIFVRGLQIQQLELEAVLSLSRQKNSRTYLYI